MSNIPQASHLHKNEVHLAGVLAHDPELRYTPTGKAVGKLSIQTKYKNFSEYHRVVVWEDLAEKVAKLHKGDFVRIVGRLQNRSWDDKNSGQKKYITEIVAFQLVIPAEEPEPLTPDIAESGTNVARAILSPAAKKSAIVSSGRVDFSPIANALEAELTVHKDGPREMVKALRPKVTDADIPF